MEHVNPGYVEFLDLSEVEDQERDWILASLYTWNPNIQLPWIENPTGPPDHRSFQVKRQKCIIDYNGPRNCLSTTEPAHIIHPCLIPGALYPPMCYPQPEIAHVIPNPEIPIISNNVYEVNEVIPAFNQMQLDAVAPGLMDYADEIEMNNKEEYEEQNGVEQEVEVQSSPQPATKSWASLFNISLKAEESPARSMLPVSTLTPPNFKETAEKVVSDVAPLLKEPFKSNIDDPNLHRMGEYLATHTVDNRIISLQPRGLINRSNYCYINSILQAMLACPPVYNLINGLAEQTSPSTEKKRITPTIDSMTKFVKEFHHLPAGLRVGRRLDKNQKKEHSVVVNCDTPFEPFWMHKMLNGLRSDTFVVEGRQEDAEEFLGCVLNGLNDEMLELMKLVGGLQEGSESPPKNCVQEEDKEWQVMGPKNKGAVTRRTELNRTPISDIFGGLVRSRLHRAGDQSTDNIQPFFTLQLNIEKATSVREALEVLVCKSQLEGVTSSKTNEEVEAWQQVTIEELPVVLVLHLKCFDYKVDGCSKIVKALEFPIDLKIDMKLLSSKTNYTPKERMYKLFAVVYHEGKEATKGHYVTDAYHVGYASWLRYDDAAVKAVPEEHVLKPHGTRVPYLLFYRRSDALAKHK